MAVSILLTGIIIPNILQIAFSKNLFDAVDERKVHRGIVPRLGGISFLPAIGISVCLVTGLGLRIGSEVLEVTMSQSVVALLLLAAALLMMYLIGIADDLVGVRYRDKFVFQILCAILIVASGMWIYDFYGFLWIKRVPDIVGWLVTIFLVVFVVNAINLIDGIDGLASGLSGMALIWYSYVFYGSGQYIWMLVAGATIGTLIPFFYYNVFGSAETRTKIFMGDTGSLTIGLILSFLCIAIFNIPAECVPDGENAFILAIAPIIIPCFDVVRVFIHRVRKGRNPFLPDKSHIHHKLLALGLQQRYALISILLCDAVLIVLNLMLSSRFAPTWIVLADVTFWTLLNIVLTKLIRRRELKLGKILYE